MCNFRLKIKYQGRTEHYFCGTCSGSMKYALIVMVDGRGIGSAHSEEFDDNLQEK